MRIRIQTIISGPITTERGDELQSTHFYAVQYPLGLHTLDEGRQFLQS